MTPLPYSIAASPSTCRRKPLDGISVTSGDPIQSIGKLGEFAETAKRRLPSQRLKAHRRDSTNMKTALADTKCFSNVGLTLAQVTGQMNLQAHPTSIHGPGPAEIVYFITV